MNAGENLAHGWTGICVCSSTYRRPGTPWTPTPSIRNQQVAGSIPAGDSISLQQLTNEVAFRPSGSPAKLARTRFQVGSSWYLHGRQLPSSRSEMRFGVCRTGECPRSWQSSLGRHLQGVDSRTRDPESDFAPEKSPDPRRTHVISFPRYTRNQPRHSAPPLARRCCGIQGRQTL
jgi:hypothetical protein